MAKNKTLTEVNANLTDGRHRRGQDNRARIVAAMLEIIREGEVAPGAEQVATRAAVGLRTVFRHFQDMESLYREMAGEIERELMVIAEQPFRAEDWKERLLELVQRRARAFERIAPFKRAADAFRHRSTFLQAHNVRFAATLRHILVQQLPADGAEQKEWLDLLDLLLSFEAWSRLRREQGLSPEHAQQVLEMAVRRMI